MGSITIVGIGIWKKHLNEEAMEILKSNQTIVLQTEQCYMTQWLRENGIPYHTMDHLYERAADFESWMEAIAEELTEKSENANVVYAVPGSAQGLPVTQAIYEAGKKKQAVVRMLAGLALGDALQADALQFGWIENARNVYASEVEDCVNHAKQPICIQELDSIYAASSVKLHLMEFFPEDWPIWLGIANESHFEWIHISLYELDRQEEKWYSHRTGLCMGAVPFAQRSVYDAEDLQTILAMLRAPNGCPWDRAQTNQSMKNNTLEEAYELIEAIELNRDDKMVEELGDVFMLLHFHAAIAQEQGRFTLSEIYTRICEKLIYRHPHVFAKTEVPIQTIEDNSKQWDELKRAEKGQTYFAETLYDVPKPFPALMRAQKVLKRAAKAGLPERQGDKIEERIQKEIDALERIVKKEDKTDVQHVVGLLLLNIVALANEYKIDVEESLRIEVEQFCKAFDEIERAAIADHKRINEIKSDQIWQ